MKPRRAQHHHADFDAETVAARKGTNRISVCFPARDEAATIGSIVATVRRELVERVPLVDEIIVMDDGSHDGTGRLASAEGAVVHRGAGVLPDLGAGTGKGEALWKSLHVSTGDIVVWCDSDITNFDERFLLGLVGPIVLDTGVEFVKGFYERPVDVVPPLTGGRTTEIARRNGAGAIHQVDLGTRSHRHRTLQELSAQSLAIMQTAFVKAGLDHGAAAATLMRPGLEPLVVAFTERPPMIEVPEYRRAHSQRVVG
jgi:glucosyl-3-phosphoglycerate synthase